MSLRNLVPSESDVRTAYADLCMEHEPRYVPIAHTGTHACMTCDEVWPCRIAIVLSGYRELHKSSNTLLETLANAAASYRAEAEATKSKTQE